MELEASFSTNTRAPYGRACTNCSRVKCRCIYKPGELICERCQRLKKACQSSPSPRVRVTNNRSISRTARLEQKVDGLVSLLNSQTAMNNPHPALSHTQLISTQPIQVSVQTPQSTHNESPSQESGVLLVRPISDTLTEEHLAKFRQSFLPFFPFVYIPATTSASELRIQKPFLSLVIVSLTTRSASQQIKLLDTIRQIVSEKILAKHEKSMDLILGLICHLAWYQYHKNKTYSVMWTQVAVAMLFQLGIHKAGFRDVGRFSTKTDLASPDLLTGPIRSLEERRTILGVFILSSMLWTNLRQIEALRWTPYMEDCVRTLREEKQSKLDLVLAFQAKCHVVIEQINHPPFDWGIGDEITRPSAAYVVKVLQQDIRQSLPVEMQTNRIVLLSLYSTDINGKESLLYKPHAQDQIDLRRLDELDSLVTAIERWYEEFCKIPLVDWIGVSFEIFAQFWNCITLLFKLSTLEEPGWDTQEIKKRIDVLRILEDFALGFERLPAAVGLVDDTGEGETGPTFRAAPHIRATKAKFIADLTPATLQPDSQLGALDISEYFETYFDDDPWLTEMFDSR